MFDSDEDEKGSVFKVVINDEEQYSIWPMARDDPPGWRDVGRSGSKDECLKYIDQVWKDMRPRSLREAMDKLTEESQDGGTGH